VKATLRGGCGPTLSIVPEWKLQCFYSYAPNYTALRHRLENAHAALEAAAVEGRRRVRLNKGRER
jgi:hypothetical protein